ncbi:hypothetical protein PUN28_006644 [Cardiocondyla obscurior]|uniref:Uncharacterized protein n=1 Tax=Cardiocondyla obscurior TaxID=286306 RepID=A0AAW2GBK2_9HYME
MTACVFCGSNIESSGDTHTAGAGKGCRDDEESPGVGDSRAPRGKRRPDKSSFARRIINSPGLYGLPIPRPPTTARSVPFNES